MRCCRLRSLAVAALVAALPLAARAQAKDEKFTFEPSGWLVLNTWANDGNLNAVDLPRWAIPPDTESAFGMGVRQSRVRMNVGIPTDGLIGSAKLRGFIEIDFMGGNANMGPDDSLPLLRLRHAYAAATWKDLGNLTVLAGQTWGILGGPYFADSLSHLAIPRFGGAGFLFRRAPQVRVSGELGKTLAFMYAAAIVAPMDPNKANPTSSLPASARAARPNWEGRVATAYRAAPKQALEVGLSAHYGKELYSLNGLASSPDQGVESRGLALDGKLDLPYVTLKGAGFVGDNLDIYYSYAPGVIQTTVAPNDARLTGVQNVSTRGFWAQAVVSPIPKISLLLGMGLEQPRTAGISQQKNKQVSAGVIGNLSSRWRASFEYTNYHTDTTAGRYESGQYEVSALLAF